MIKILYKVIKLFYKNVRELSPKPVLGFELKILELILGIISTEYDCSMANIDVLNRLFSDLTGASPESVEALPFSGSHRRYFRMAVSGHSYIGVLGTDSSENKDFTILSRHFLSKGISVPEVYCVSGDGMAYIQEDLGDTLLFDYVSRGRKSGNYSETEKNMLLAAVSGLPRIQFEGSEALGQLGTRTGFGREKVMFDCQYFKYCFLKAASVSFDEHLLQIDFETLADAVAEEGQDTFLYRDFQSRNVMVKDGKPYYIDFQGGMQGPVYYDLASFVWQARARYPESLKTEMISAYIAALSEYRKVDRISFLEKLQLFVLARTLQVLGAYGFRGYYEKKEHFLKSIPPVVENIREILLSRDLRFPYLNQVLEKIVAMYDGGKLKGAFSCMQENAGSRSLKSCNPLTVTVTSFSYKKGIPEDPSGNGGGYVFDCRSIHNPGKYDQYKSLTGRDEPVKSFLEEDGEVLSFLENVYALVDAHVSRFVSRGFTSLMVNFGCTGGQHRSVYCAESVARHLSAISGVRVHLIHREQGIDEFLN